jgi:hypothetical protein
MCGVAGSELNELLALAKEPDDHRLKSHEGRIPDELRTLIFHESTATEIDTVEPIYIPGVTQTEDYARALFYEVGNEDARIIENAVKIRMARRNVLTKVGPPQCMFYVHENVLRSAVGGPQIMYEQMLHLLFLDTRPQCCIRVIPSSAAARGSAPGSFHIFGYPEGSPVICIQHETTSQFLETKNDVASYRAVVKRVASVALDEAQSREFVSGMASYYERQGAATHDGGSTELA